MNASSPDSLKAKLESFVIGKDSILTRLRGARRVQELSRFIFSVGDVLNIVSKIYTTSEKLKGEERKKQEQVSREI